MRKFGLRFVFLTLLFVFISACSNTASGGDSVSSNGGGGSSSSRYLTDRYFWGKWTRMDNGLEYEITETRIYEGSSYYNITFATKNSFTCALGTFEKQSGSVMLLDKTPIFRNGGSNIEYTVMLVGFVQDTMARAATASSTARPLSGQRVVNTTEKYASYTEEAVSDENGVIVLHSPVAGTGNTIQITSSDGSLISANVAPVNSGEHAGTIPVVPFGMYSLKVTGEIPSEQTEDDDGYLYTGRIYNMVVKIENITEFEAETSVVTIEPADSRISISGSTVSTVSTLTAHQVKEMNLSVYCAGLSVPYIDTYLKVTFEDSSLARNVWVDRIPLRIFSGKETVQVRAESTEGNKDSCLNGFVIYPDGNSQYFSVPHGQTKNILVPSFSALEPYKLSFCGATTGASLGDSTEMKYSIGVNTNAPSTNGNFSINEILAYEPNDTENAAASLGTAETLKAYLKKGDIDFYSVAVSAYRPNANYIVNHYLEKLDSGYSLEQTEECVGKVGLDTMATAKTFVGFTPKSFSQVAVQESGNSVVNIYYDRKTVTATFDTAGGSFADGTTAKIVSGKYGAQLAPPAEPIRTGYTFAGWRNISATFPANDVTYHAEWNTIPYSITYNLNGGTNAASNPTTYTVESATITLAAPTRTGYTFAGWYTNSGFTTQKTQIANGSTGNVVLYAKWEIINYNIAYNLNGGTNAASNPATYTVESATITFATPTRTGYTFAGWYTDSGFTTQRTQIASGSTGNVTLYAKWSPISYNITYNLKGGTNAASNPATYTVESATITLAAPTRTGYTFAGWYTNSGFTTQKTQIANGSTGNVVLYAKWEIINYSITYNLNGGANNANNPATYTVESATITLAAPTRTGYTFAGWYTNSGFTTQKTQIANGSTGNVTLYAKWLSNNLAITVTLPNANEDMAKLTYTNNSGVLNFTAQNGYSNYVWYFDDAVVQNGSANTYNLDTALNSVKVGAHFVMVLATDSSGNSYSSQAQVVVRK